MRTKIGPRQSPAPCKRQGRRFQWFASLRRVVLGLLIALTCIILAPSPAPSQQGGQYGSNARRTPPPIPDDSASSRDIGPEPPNTRQMVRMMHANFEKSKSDAAELAALAKELRMKLDSAHGDVLPSEVAKCAEKMEKLAKKIRGEAIGF